MWLHLPHPPIHGMCVCALVVVVVSDLPLGLQTEENQPREVDPPSSLVHEMGEKHFGTKGTWIILHVSRENLTSVYTRFTHVFSLFFFFSTHTRKDSFSFIKLEVMLCVQDLKSVLSECTNELTGKRKWLH